MYKYSQFIRFDLTWVIMFYWKPIASYGVMKLVASLNRKSKLGPVVEISIKNCPVAFWK